MLNPTFDVDVACPTMLRPRTVVVPKPPSAISRAFIEDVAVPAIVVVPIENTVPSFRKAVIAWPATPDPRKSCGERLDVMSKLPAPTGVVVPIPTVPRKYELAVVVERRFPTVSCVPVAMRLPEAFVVMMEFAANVFAAKICEASVEVEIVETNPVEPVYAKPCESDDNRSAELNVDDAVENNPPVKPIAVEVELYPATEVNGNAPAAVTKPASFVSCDVLIVDVAKEYVWPFAPMPAKPEAREPRLSVPMLAAVADAYAKDARVVEELVNVWRPVNVLVSERSVEEAAPERDVRKPASLLNHERFTDEDAIVFTKPPVPRYANPCESEGRENDPVNLSAPLKVFASERSVDEANVHVDVEKLYT
jgi:hypothetical protein